MSDECESGANGEHEMDFEKMTYERHVGLHSAVFKVHCLHCGGLGTITIDALEADWD